MCLTDFYLFFFFFFFFFFFLVRFISSLRGVWFIINIGIKHGFSCINIRQVKWEVLKTEAEETWRVLMHWNTMLDRCICIKTVHICYVLRYSLHYFVSPLRRCLANAISTDYARSRTGQYTSRNGSKSVSSVRSYWKLRSRSLTARCLVNTRLLPVNARPKITFGTAFMQ